MGAQSALILMLVALEFTIADADGDTAPISTIVSVDGATTLNDLIADYADVFYYGIANLYLGTPVRGRASVILDLAAYLDFTGAAFWDSDVQEGVTFKFRTSTGLPTEITIPCFYEPYLTDSGAGKVADLTNSAVLGFIAIMTEDIGSGGIDAVDSHGHDISRFVSAEQSFNRRKR